MSPHLLWNLNAKHRDNSVVPSEVKKLIDEINELPPMPNMAKRLLDLKSNPRADAKQLVKIIELDASLAAQVLKWASSPLYGSRKNVTLHEAVTFIIGFEHVLNLAFGLCALGQLRVPKEGPLGTKFFWLQFLAGQRLAQRLSLLSGKADANIVNLSYLLHNTGHLIMAHFFKEHFKNLTSAILSEPDAGVFCLERKLLGIDHGVIGAWLLTNWRLYEPIQTVTLHHHNPFYTGNHERLVWITCLADSLLGMLDIGDSRDFTVIKTPLCANLGIEEHKALDALNDVREKLDYLNDCVTELV